MTVPALLLGARPHQSIISIGFSGLVNALFSGFTNWIEAGTVALIAAFGHAIDATTRAPIGAGFMTEFGVIWRIAAIFAAPFLFIAVIQAVVRQDIGLLARAVLLRLPFALIFGGIAVELVAEALSITDSLSSAVLSVAGNPARSDVGALVSAFSPGPTGLTLTGFVGALLAVVAAVVAFLLWIELALRSAAIAVATLFIPLALVGLVWSATSHWARRVGETIAALVCSKLVIAGVLALAALSLRTDSGVSGVVEGIALLVLAALAPFSLLRLIPIIESGASGHFEGLARRGLRAGRDAAALAVGAFGAEEIATTPRSTGGVDFLPGLDLRGPEYDEAVGRYRELLDERATSLQGDSNVAEVVGSPPDAARSGRDG